MQAPAAYKFQVALRCSTVGAQPHHPCRREFRTNTIRTVTAFPCCPLRHSTSFPLSLLPATCCYPKPRNQTSLQSILPTPDGLELVISTKLVRYHPQLRVFTFRPHPATRFFLVSRPAIALIPESPHFCRLLASRLKFAAQPDSPFRCFISLPCHSTLTALCSL